MTFIVKFGSTNCANNLNRFYISGDLIIRILRGYASGGDFEQSASISATDTFSKRDSFKSKLPAIVLFSIFCVLFSCRLVTHLLLPVMFTVLSFQVKHSPWKSAIPFRSVQTIGLSQIASCPITALMFWNVIRTKSVYH